MELCIASVQNTFLTDNNPMPYEISGLHHSVVEDFTLLGC